MTIEEELALTSTAVSAIGKIYELVTSAKSGKLEPKTVSDALAAFKTSLTANDLNADAALDKKFP